MKKSFVKKVVKVQDYPDKPFKITMYGKSENSKFKLGDKVYIINNDRVGWSLLEVIGFEKNGDVYVSPCPWDNTRGGFSDSDLIHKKEYDSVKKNLPDKFKEMISRRIKENIDYFSRQGKELTRKEVNFMSKNCKINLILTKWYMIQEEELIN